MRVNLIAEDFLFLQVHERCSGLFDRIDDINRPSFDLVEYPSNIFSDKPDGNELNSAKKHDGDHQRRVARYVHTRDDCMHDNECGVEKRKYGNDSPDIQPQTKRYG